MSKDSARQAWTKLVEERECEAKQPRVKKRVKEEVSQAELDAELDDLVTEHVLKTSGRTGISSTYTTKCPRDFYFPLAPAAMGSRILIPNPAGEPAVPSIGGVVTISSQLAGSWSNTQLVDEPWVLRQQWERRLRAGHLQRIRPRRYVLASSAIAEPNVSQSFFLTFLSVKAFFAALVMNTEA